MRLIRPACMLLLLSAFAAPSLAAGESGPAVYPERPRFIVNTPVGLGPEDKPQLRVQVVVPYSELLFMKKAADRYGARFELVIIVYDADGEQIGGDLWTPEVSAPSFAATMDPVNAFSQEETFTVPSGKVRVKVSIKDSGSGKEAEILRKLEIPAFDALPLSMSDLRFVPCASETSAALKPAYVRGRFGGDPLPPICVAGEIYDRERRSGPESYRIIWHVLNDKGLEKKADTLEVAGDSKRTPFGFEPDFTPFSLGRYELAVEVRRDGRKVERSAPFEMDETRLSLTANYRDLVDMAGYIGTSTEITKLQNAMAPSERDSLWDAFWYRRDPSPGTPENELKEEFFRRIQYANETFTSVDSPGWRSDRGVVYIRNGPPDQIETHPINPSDPPYEIWRYDALNRVFVFADLDGFGQYTLVRTGRASNE